MKILPLTKQLRRLDLVKPSVSWRQKNREFLLSEINKNKTVVEVSDFAAIKDFGFNLNSMIAVVSFLLPERQTMRVLRSTSALLSLTVFMLAGGIFSVSAAQETVPGDVLYNLKIASEKVQQALTVDEAAKVKLEIDLAGKRIAELEKIMVAAEYSDTDVTDDQVAQVIDKFEKNLTTAKNNLAEVSVTASADETVLLAEELDNKTSKYQVSLDNVVGGVVSDEVKKKVQQASSSAEASSEEALSLMVKKHASGETKILSTELTAKINNKIDKLNYTLENMNNEITGLLVDANDQIILSQSSKTRATTTTSLLIAQDQLNVATKILAEAQSLSTEAALEDALGKINETKVLAEVAKVRVETILGDIVEPRSAIDDQIEDVNATGTAPVIK